MRAKPMAEPLKNRTLEACPRSNHFVLSMFTQTIKPNSMKSIFFPILLAISLVACNMGKSSTSSADDAPEKATPGQQFGKKIEARGAISYAELAALMEGKDSLRIKVKGTVEEVCQKKGCWLTLKAERPKDQPLFTGFKDYAYFMPKDLSGHVVVMEGLAYRELVPVEQLQHLAEDAGASPEEIASITEAEEQLRFIADGVLVVN